MAVVGCPLEINVGGNSCRDSVGQVKLIALPRPQDHVVSMDATDDGAFTATVLRPSAGGTFLESRFQGRIQAGDKLHLKIPADGEREPQLSRES